MVLPLEDVELRHLRYFLAVADMLHFSRAASKLGIQQPPLSQQIARLETLLGCQLFFRSRSGPTRITLTDAGRVLQTQAGRLLAETALVLEASRAADRGELGTLRVAFVASLARSALPRALREFRKAWPSVALHLQESTTARILEGLSVGEIDIGIGREVPSISGIETCELFNEPLLVAVPSGYVPDRQTNVSLSALAKYDFVMPPRTAGPKFYDRLMGPLLGAGVSPRIQQEATEWSTIVALVNAGVGITIAPASALAAAGTGIKVLKPVGPEIRTRVDICWRNRESGALAGNFVTVMQAAFAA